MDSHVLRNWLAPPLGLNDSRGQGACVKIVDALEVFGENWFLHIDFIMNLLDHSLGRNPVHDTPALLSLCPFTALTSKHLLVKASAGLGLRAVSSYDIWGDRSGQLDSHQKKEEIMYRSLRKQSTKKHEEKSLTMPA